MRITDFLKAFSAEELKEYEKAIVSPFFNEGRNLLSFYKEIRKFHPSYTDKKLTEQYIYNKVYPDKPFNKQVMKNALSKLVKMAEEYLCFKKIIRSGYVFDTILSEALMEKGINNYAKLKLKKAGKELAGSLIDENYFRYYYEISRLKTELYSIEWKIPHIGKKLDEEANNFVYYSFVKMVNLFNKMNIVNRNFNTSFASSVVPPILNSIDPETANSYFHKNPLENKAVKELYVYFFKYTINPLDVKNYENLKKTFLKASRSLSSVENINFSMHLINACQSLFKIDDIKYSRESLSLHKDLLFKYVEANYGSLIIHNPVLRNIIYLTFKTGEFKWLEKFIEAYKRSYDPNYSDIMLSYSYAFLEFGRKNYLKSLEYADKVKTNLESYKLDFRMLCLMNYYELNYMDEAFRAMRNFKKFLNESKYLSGDFRLTSSNFLKYYNILFKCKEKENFENLDKFRKEIDKNKRISFHKWIAQKADELI